MRKRILSLIMAATLLLSLTGTAYAASTTVTDDVMYMYEVLKSLNVMDDPNTEPVIIRHTFKLVTGATGADTTDYGLFREVSKRNFINYVCNMLDDYGFTSEYSDDAVKILEDAGIIHANQDDLYKPLYYEEAATMLVRLLEYGDIAESVGWPYGYTTVAARLGLDKGVKASVGQIMTMSDVIRLLYNTLNAPYAQMMYISGDDIVYSATTEKTFLYEYRKIYKIEGIVESTGTAALSKVIPVNEGQMMIDGYIYAAGKDFTDMLGMNVEAYVQESGSGQDVVISATAVGNDELVIDAEDIKSVSDDVKTITYYDGDKEKTATLSPTVAIIYNGQPLSPYTKDDLIIADGNLRLINNDNGGFDTVFITDYKTYVVDYISTANKVIRNAYTFDAENITLNMEEKAEDVIIIVSEDGKDLTLSDITKGDVLKVAASFVNNKRVIFVKHTRKRITGTVEKILKNETTELSVSGTEYALSKCYETALAKGDSEAEKLYTGNDYIFYLDSDGKIAYAVEADETQRYGLVMATSVTSGIIGECRAKIFTTEGEFEEYLFAEKVEFNDEKGRLAETVVGQIPTGMNGDVSFVCYALNSKGEIRMIKTPKTFSDLTIDEFNVRADLTNKYRPNNTSFESDVFIADGAIILVVDKDKLNLEESYSIITTAGLSNDNDHTFNAYNVDDFGFAEYIVLDNNDTLKNNKLSANDLFVVTAVGETVDSNGDITGMVTGMMGAYEELTYYCDDVSIYNRIAVGDVISMVTDKNGRIVYLPDENIYYSVADGTVKEDWANGIHTINTILKGTVKENDISNLRIKIDCGAIERVARTALDTLVIIYDMEKDTISRGTIADIEEDAQVVMKVRQSKLMCVVVYQ